MLKKEFREKMVTEKKKPKTRYFIGVTASMPSEERDSFREAAKECNCCVSEYIRRLHKMAQETTNE